MGRRDNNNDYYGNTNDRQGGRRNNFDNAYDANQYGCNDNYNNRGGQPPQDNYNNVRGGQPQYDNYNGGRGVQPNYNDYQTMGAQPFRERPPMTEQSQYQPNATMDKIKSEVTGANNVIVMAPKNYVDVKHLIDNLRAKQAIVVELNVIDEQDGQRVLDFLSGAIYALGGSMQRITASIFLFTPCGVSIQLPFDLINRK